jgi:hypothetical protein
MQQLSALLRLPASALTLERDSAVTDRGFSVFCWVGGGSGLAACIAAFIAGASLDSPLGMIALLQTVILVLPVGLKLGMQLKTLTFLGLLYAQGMLLFAAFTLGGFASPAMPWFATIPIFAYYYLRGWPRLCVLAFMVASLVAIGLAPVFGVTLHSPIPPPLFNTASFTSAISRECLPGYPRFDTARCLKQSNYRKNGSVKPNGPTRQSHNFLPTSVMNCVHHLMQSSDSPTWSVIKP